MRLMLLPSNTRKTECGASQFLTPMVVRAAPFALFEEHAGNGDRRERCFSSVDGRAGPCPL